ncbi:unnamed protein product [Polarella glacialis]|uniref:Uncharacterized protein n=1 Tax=Polarella glacialis TaxID=89957 RepID=A0A813LMF3_POLGL|nr:unnamed protein product [Polarella glacialis]
MTCSPEGESVGEKEKKNGSLTIQLRSVASWSVDAFCAPLINLGKGRTDLISSRTQALTSNRLHIISNNDNNNNKNNNNSSNNNNYNNIGAPHTPNETELPCDG